MREYLTDSKFLSMLDEMRIKKHYAKITVLSFVDEKPLREIQGIATAGSVTVNGQAALRRTISLTVSGIENENDINNIENIISINKKVKIEVGLENPFEDYKDYGDIIWFPLGTYVINQATTSTTASSANISISGKDKMCMLDGTCGGTLPSAVTFHETQHEDDNGDIFIEQVPIFTIIKECVTHFGKEPEQNVIINDVDMTAKLSTKYVGQNPIWFSKDYKSFVISENAPEDENFLQHKFIYGQDVGYQETDFTYPGELVFSAGDTVTSVLDKIIESLGNYEYFYDLDGHFIFQQKKNYLNYYYTPITQINDNYYIKAFSDSKYYYTFIDAKDALSYYNSPKYENIKNDFIVWGDKTDANGVTKTIQYHLAIDEKPQIDLANQYMWDITKGNGDHAYYLFEYEKNNYNQTPEQKAIEIIYTENHSEITDSSIETAIKKDITNNILQNYSFYNGDQFILYYKVIFSDQIRYYKVVLLNREIIDFIYLEDLTDIIDFTYLAFGVYPKKDEEDESDDSSSSDNEPIGRPDKPNAPDLDSGFGIPDSWHRDTQRDKQNQLDPDFSVDSNEPSKYPNDSDDKKDDTTKVKNKEFYLVQKRIIDNVDVLGYYNKKGEWIQIFELSEKLNLTNINNLINKVKQNYYLKIIKDINFDEINKEYDFNFINQNNVLLVSSTGLLIYKLNSYDSKGNKQEYNYSIPDSYSAIKDSENKTLISEEEHKELVKVLLEYYKTNKDDLIDDITLIYNYTDINDISGDNPSGNDPIGHPNSPNAPGLDPGFGIPDSWHKNTNSIKSQDQIDSYFGVNSKGKTSSDTKKDNNSSGSDNKKGSDLLLPFLDPVEGKKDQLKVLKDQEDIIKKIFILRDNGNYTLNEIIEEITNAYNSNVIDFSILPENSKIKIITYTPKEPEFDYEDNFYFTLIGTPCHEWREELFRQALLNSENGSQKGDYDDELLAKINNEYLWRKQLFDPQNETWHEEWNNQIDSANSNEEKIDTWDGWNPAIYIDPSLITYWLDFIDVDQLVSKYSVNKIGRRTKALTKTNMSLLYKLNVPDVIFFENTGEADLIQKIEEYTLEGQAYCALKPGQMKLFSSSGTGSTAFDYIREMLYQYLIYNLTVTINCAPRYYLEPNNLIYIDDKKSNIKGEFVITQYTLPLTYNGNMSITTNEALTRV